MPALKRPDETVRLPLPPRQALLGGETDVLVVGGGPAGLGAAIAAADAGARVVLAERYGFLGGNATAALVMPLMSFHTQMPTAEKKGATTLLPTDHGPGDAVVHGVLARLLERLVRAGGAIAPSLETGYTVPFDPEWFKLIALELLDEAGVEFLFHAFASGVLPRSEGVVFETKSGPLAIRAKVIIDCTGDGDVAVQAGAPYEVGRADGLVQPMTLMFRVTEFLRTEFDELRARQPEGMARRARPVGAGAPGDRGGRAQPAARGHALFCHAARERGQRQQHPRYARARRRCLGPELCRVVQPPPDAPDRRFPAALCPRASRTRTSCKAACRSGVRETRRVLGEYQLTADDVLGARKFDDAIARGAYPVDIHNPKGSGTVLKRLPAGEAYDIPLRCLLPRNTERVIVAGRCISGTHEAHSSYRVMPIVMATGQAAGVCAALAAHTGITPRQVPVREVQRELVRQRASLRRDLVVGTATASPRATV